MQLWNDYEGNIIAGNYPLEKFLRPEGRSAIFATRNAAGTLADIRLTEALNDEDGILGRWRTVADLKHPNLVAITQYGQTELDGAPLVYAVMEPTETNLEDVLRERPLSVEETRQVAVALVAALQALHSRGLIHEIMESASVLAVGEVIKLRSDCIRQAHAEDESEFKTRNVQDLSVILLQALTQQRKPGNRPLPPPFDQIVRNGMSGAWGLTQIEEVLTPPVRSKGKPSAFAAFASATPAPTTPASATPASATPASATSAPAAALAAAMPAKSGAAAYTRASAPANSSTSKPAGIAARPVGLTGLRENEDGRRRIGIWIAVVIAALLVFLIGLHHFHSSPSTRTMTTSPPASVVSAPSAAAAAPPPAAVDSKPSDRPSPLGKDQPQAAASGASWRVVAYTFNHESQAQERAASIAKKHAALNPEVFTPTGRAPYLVTLGGPMSRDQAFATRAKALAAGFPRDVYAQNYTAKSR